MKEMSWQISSKIAIIWSDRSIYDKIFIGKPILVSSLLAIRRKSRKK